MARSRCRTDAAAISAKSCRTAPAWLGDTAAAAREPSEACWTARGIVLVTLLAIIPSCRDDGLATGTIESIDIIPYDLSESSDSDVHTASTMDSLEGGGGCSGSCGCGIAAGVCLVQQCAADGAQCITGPRPDGTICGPQNTEPKWKKGGHCEVGSCIPDFTVCDDQNACTLDERQFDLARVGQCDHRAVECDDKNPCTDDWCDKYAGCQAKANSSTCVRSDNCAAGVCKAGTCDGSVPACGAGAKCAIGKGCSCAGGQTGEGLSCACPAQTLGMRVNGVVQCAADYPVWGAEPNQPIALTANGDGTVTHGTTGLMWQQVETADPGEFHASQANYCEMLQLGGHADWRLPTAAELASIFAYPPPGADPYVNVWPDASSPLGPKATGAFVWIATATPIAAEVARFWALSNVWGLQPMRGDDQGMAPGGRVRCVRSTLDYEAKLHLAPKQRFSLAGSIAQDAVTGLAWQRHTCATPMTFGTAQEYCKGNAAGLPGSGWRLPTIRELQSLVDRQRSTGALDPEVFPTVCAQPLWPFWSTNAWLQGGARFVVNAESGETSWACGKDEGCLVEPVTHTACVRCVR